MVLPSTQSSLQFCVGRPIALCLLKTCIALYRFRPIFYLPSLFSSWLSASELSVVSSSSDVFYYASICNYYSFYFCSWTSQSWSVSGYSANLAALWRKFFRSRCYLIMEKSFLRFFYCLMSSTSLFVSYISPLYFTLHFLRFSSL